LESYQSVDVGNGLALTIWTSAAQVWQKERSGIKLAVGLLTTKSWESTQSRCVHGECDAPLEKSQQELQLCFKPRPNQRSEQRVIVPQSCESLNRGSFGTPPWESRDKKPFGCGLREEAQRIIYGGRWWLPPNLGHGESYESKVARGLS